jgi:transposase-like protein
MIVLSLGSRFYFCVSKACSAPIESGILMERRMGESNGIDSLLGGWAMPKAYSGDMRQRVIAEVESGASRRAAAEEFAVSASTAIIWVKCFRETGRCALTRSGSELAGENLAMGHLRHMRCRSSEPFRRYRVLVGNSYHQFSR